MIVEKPGSAIRFVLNSGACFSLPHAWIFNHSCSILENTCLDTVFQSLRKSKRSTPKSDQEMETLITGSCIFIHHLIIRNERVYLICTVLLMKNSGQFSNLPKADIFQAHMVIWYLRCRLWAHVGLLRVLTRNLIQYKLYIKELKIFVTFLS